MGVEVRAGVRQGTSPQTSSAHLALMEWMPLLTASQCNKVEVPAVLGEPDLDFTRLTRDAAGGGQVEAHGTPSDYQHIT
jgi:hypothetical protein